MQNDTTDNLLQLRGPSYLMIPMFVRGNQEELMRISDILSQVKDQVLTRTMATVSIPPEERSAYHSVFEELHRSVADLDKKLPLLYMLSGSAHDIWVKRMAAAAAVVEQQHEFLLASADPRFILSLEALRSLQSEVQKAQEQFNLAIHTVFGANQQQPSPGGGVDDPSD